MGGVNEDARVGFVGLGTMGGPMAANLARAGYDVSTYDLDPSRIERCLASGARGASSVGEVVCDAAVVFFSLPNSETTVRVLEEEALPKATEGQVLVDLGTTVAAEARRLAALFTERGANLLDVPVSGGDAGARSGTLYMFAGGDWTAFDRIRPLLEILGDPRHITYCGPSGAGQVVKSVNQLAMGLPVAAYLEAIAFGVRAGVDVETIERAVGGTGGFRSEVRRLARAVLKGEGERITIKFPEFGYFLSEVREKEFPAPILEALYAFLDPCERRERDNMNRPEPSLWYELMHRENGPPK